MSSFVELLQLGKKDLAENQFQQAAENFAKCISLDPKNNEPYYLLAEIYKKFQRYDDAIFFLDTAYQNCEVDKELSLGYIGLVYFHKNEFEKAKAYIQKALELKPDADRFYGILGNIENTQGNQVKAIEYYLEELALSPRAATYYDLATSYKSIGEIDKSIAALKSCLELDPGWIDAKANLLSFMLYSPQLSKPQIKKEAEEYYRDYILPGLGSKKGIFDFSSWDKNLDRKLKVGIVTGDFWSHPTSFFLEGVLKEIDKENFEFHTFDVCGDLSDQGFNADHIKSQVHSWHDVSQLDSFAAANYIYQQKIDVLLDLSGHTRNNRLDVFVLKPAPVQASWLAYPSTTGISEIDYLLVDHNTVREDEENLYTEKPYRLNCSQTPFSISVPNEILEAPYRKNGYISYGCLNNFSKVNSEVLELWSDLLMKDVSSKLLLKTFILNDKDLQERILSFFEQRGVARERIILGGSDAREKFIDSYNEVDIALDVFPYCGATTSVELLLMGVPLVSLEGSSWHTRVSAGLMRAVGLEDLIAVTKEEYIAKAMKLAQDKDRIDFCRKNLRQLALSSSANAASFAAELQTALKTMFRLKIF